jgi:hypothetical protein
MADGLPHGTIAFDVDYDFGPDKEKVISTIPMPSLAKRLGYKDLGWKWIDGQCLVTRVKGCDAYVSVMVPDPNVPFSRATITGDQLIVELGGQDHIGDPAKIVYKACELLGVRERCEDYALVDQAYAKIAPIDEGERRNFIYYASTITGRAYQLGRFATWRPRLLLDDLVHDVRLIEGWVTSPSPAYDQQLHERKVNQ